MSALRGVAGSVGETVVADPSMTKNLVRVTTDQLVLIGVILLASALAVGYQLLRHFGWRFFGDDT